MTAIATFAADGFIDRLPADVRFFLVHGADEGLTHALAAGEHITSMGGHPSLRIGKLLETHRHDIDQILREAMEHEQEGVDTYRKLLELVRDRDVMLEEYARRMVHDEEVHITEIEKMLRRPGKLETAR